MTKSGESTIINHNRQIMSRNLYPKRNSYIKERGTIIMTKIKNTKKGMAKKTLSMSLVVAMLATSNVPVWAAEFSDGSDVAVTSDAEASVAETFSDDVTETPVVEDTTDNTAVATAVLSVVSSTTGVSVTSSENVSATEASASDVTATSEPSLNSAAHTGTLEVASIATTSDILNVFFAMPFFVFLIFVMIIVPLSLI